MDKTAIKNFAIESRKILRESAIKKAGMYGITIDECSKPIQKGADFEVYKTIAGDEIRLYSKELKMRSNLVNVIKEKGFEQVIEETAYTWFNRLIAIRFMEVNDYLPTRVRVLSSETGSSTPDIVTHSLDVDLNLSADEIDKIQAAKDDNRFDDAFQLLFVKQCNELNKILPGLFEKTDDYMELLLDISYTSDGVVRMLVDDVEEDDFNVEKKGQVEIIGWLYQYYNTEPKNKVINVLKGGSIKKEDIPAATQLFTTDWVVKYIVDNSVGRYWIERNPQSELAEKLKYLVLPKNGVVNYISEKVKPEEISVLDNCMGSGHFIVYVIDVLMMIYEECGYNERDAIHSILENNIYGLDIDKRAYQLAYFAVLMKARQYDRRILIKDVSPHIHVIDESNSISKTSFDWMDCNHKEIADYLYGVFYDAKEYGSIISVKTYDYKNFITYCEEWLENHEISFENYISESDIKAMIVLANQAIVMCGQYTAVVTNPPYMNRFDSKLKSFVLENYKDYSSDMFSIFMIKNFENCKTDGYLGFMTPMVWMFLKTYEETRKKIIDNKEIVTLIQLEYSAFEEATVPLCTFVMCNKKYNRCGEYLRLTNFKGGMKIQEQKVIDAIIGKDNSYLYESNQDNFNIIDGKPIAYWISEHFISVFKNAKKLENYCASFQGIITGDNNLYLRSWNEISYKRFCTTVKSFDEHPNNVWVPYNKGGDYRKWYGNNYYVLKWIDDGKGLTRARTENAKYHFVSGVTWTSISSGDFSCRFFPNGYLSDSKGSSVYAKKKITNEYVCAFMNSKVANEIFKVTNPTISYQVMNILALPYIEGNEDSIVNNLSKHNIELSKSDWDSFEASWDFERHPLISVISNNRMLFTDIDDIDLAECFTCWENECIERFEQLKKNEEELNGIFIDIYGLRDELTPEVEDKDVTVRKADLSRDIKSLISYAVGCMFGRYSLDETGLIYAGGDFDSSRYTTFAADDDAIIPITDEEYFDDDIVTRFVEFIRTVYGNKSLESNLDYIAKALGNKGNTSREVIRNYFLNDFFKDHCSTYSVTGSGKRPIYWLFDSGKQNGFKCLIYMHRYTPDTVGLIRSVYLKKAQDAIEASLKNAEYAIANTESAVDRASNTRKRDKYIKQLAEIKPYYQALSHVAMQRIDIDLDDGVKVNYAKFQGVEVGGEGEKKQTIDLLSKI